MSIVGAIHYLGARAGGRGRLGQGESQGTPLTRSTQDFKMAVAARQVKVATGSDHLVAVQTDTIVDPETGIAAQVEKTVVAVDRGDGTIAVHERQRIVGAVVAPPRVSHLYQFFFTL